MVGGFIVYIDRLHRKNSQNNILNENLFLLKLIRIFEYQNIAL